jgi:hypothetical protein
MRPHRPRLALLLLAAAAVFFAWTAGPSLAALVPTPEPSPICMDCGPNSGFTPRRPTEGQRIAAAWSANPTPEELPVPLPPRRG